MHEDAIDALMGAYAGAVPGAAVGVRGPGLELQRPYGCADLEAGHAVGAATSFRLASISKQFTAAAVLLAAQDGVLSLDDRVRRWLPSLPAMADAVTLRHLLTHTSGLLDFEDVMPAGTTVPLRDADVLALLEGQDRRWFEPGAGLRYSNSGYVLLALVVERASRRGYREFLAQRLFGPLGMRGSVAHEAGVSVIARRAFGYSRNGAWTRTDQSLTSATLGDGGVYSSVEDLLRWDAALEGGGPLNGESLRGMFEPAIESGEAGGAYGFGWRLSRTATAAAAWHSGESVGFRNVILRYLEPRLTVIVLTNRNEPAPLRAALDIAALYLGHRAFLDFPAAAEGPDAGAHPLPG